MDPESSDSDVSANGEGSYGPASPLAVPVQLPPPPPKHILESANNVQIRLGYLNDVDEQNGRKQNLLAGKRRRKDDRVMRKREIQDRKIKAIMDARERRDSRTMARRAREDAAFRAVDNQADEEEHVSLHSGDNVETNHRQTLRRRYKRLKRGLPPDESPHGRSISTASISPPGPAFSTIAPPAKRHQSGPPSNVDGVSPHQPSNLPPPPPPPSAPSYSFYQANQKPYTVPYHAGPVYSTVPPPPLHQTGPPPGSAPQDRSPYAPNGRPASPVPRAPLNPLPNQNTPPASTSARQTSSTYDTLPPPTTSGFASINAPTTSGFASINSRAAATPPSAYSSLTKQPDGEANHTPAGPHEPSIKHSESYGSNSGNAETPASNNGTPGTGKRTPSTTHPYQMSEAFANRHHHCERVDGFNRGIWTSFGPAGTQEHPTRPPVEMYLRCNHDNCRRIDWRTVHGLQCHIVKNHEQPKGTIGSLDKALDRYGVPIAEVEEYEREHGEGTGGTMADPKNLKIKNKIKAESGRKSTPGSYGVDPTARPAGYKPSPGVYDSPTIANSAPRSSTGSVVRRKPMHEESTNSETDDSGPIWGAPRKSGGPPPSRFEIIKNDWHGYGPNAPAGPPSRSSMDLNQQLQGDAVMRDQPPSNWKHWSPVNQSPAPPMASSRTISIPESSHKLSSGSVPPTSAPISNMPPILPTQREILSTQTQAMVEEVKKVEEKQAMDDSTFATPATQSQQTDTQMSNVSETQPVMERQDPGTDSMTERQNEIKSEPERAPASISPRMDAGGDKQTEKADDTTFTRTNTDPAPTGPGAWHTQIPSITYHNAQATQPSDKREEDEPSL